MVIPVIFNQQDNVHNLRGTATPDGHGLRVKMIQGYELTDMEIEEVFGQAGIEFVRREMVDGVMRTAEFIIKNFSIPRRERGL